MQFNPEHIKTHLRRDHSGNSGIMALTLQTEKLANTAFVYADAAAIGEEAFKALARDASEAEAKRERGLLATVGRCVLCVK